MMKSRKFALVDGGEVDEEHVKPTAPPVPLPWSAGGGDVGVSLG